jgi:hypothetical protein
MVPVSAKSSVTLQKASPKSCYFDRAKAMSNINIITVEKRKEKNKINK